MILRTAKRIAPSLLLAAGCSLSSRADLIAENQARFGQITGDVGLLSQGAAEWIAPHEGLPIEPGDRIHTGEDGEAEIILSQNAVWFLRPETDLVTEHMDSNAGRFNLSQGVLMGKVDSAHAGAQQHWEFNTPTAVCAVRGTEFALALLRPEETHLGVFEGDVEMSPAESAKGLEPPIRVAAGTEGVAVRGKALQRLDRFSPLMQPHAAWRPMLRRRLAVIQGTWSPHTQEVRKTLRSKFISPPPKRILKPRPAAVRTRRRAL